MSRRLLFDISTSMRWFGPPVGIVRVERELAKWASQNDPHCLFVFFDADLQAYREVLPNFLRPVLDGAVIADTTGMKDPSRSRPRRTERVPRFLLGPYLWLTQSRRMTLRMLGRMSLESRNSRARKIINGVQTRIAGTKYRDMLVASDGSERSLVRLDNLVGGYVQLKSGDRVLFAGSNWAHSNAAYVAEQKKRVAIDLITLCYDVIPLLYPKYFKPSDVDMLRRHFHIAFATSSLILVTAKIVADDVRQYCFQHGISAGPVRQIPLGFDLPTPAARPAEPRKDKRTGRFIMFVSTIEPRKGHRLLLAVWSRLLREQIPQRLDVSLLLVGRPGWMVDDLLETLTATDHIKILNNVSDRDLDELYDRAAFCVYPSEYEGYGLPVVEALARGKAVLASNVGVVPELDAPLLQRLPPGDEQAWYEAVKASLLNPPAIDVTPGFRHPSWQEAAAQAFAIIRERDRP